MSDKDDSEQEAGGREKPPDRLAKTSVWADHWRSIIGLIVLVVGTVAGLLAWLHSKQPAQVTVRLTTCEQYRISLETTNRGGQSAVIGHPVFTIRSQRRPNPPNLRMLSYMDAEPADVGIIEPDKRQLQIYDLTRPIFNRDEAASGTCRLHVRVPVSPGGGSHPDATGECRCVYR